MARPLKSTLVIVSVKIFDICELIPDSDSGQIYICKFNLTPTHDLLNIRDVPKVSLDLENSGRESRVYTYLQK